MSAWVAVFYRGDTAQISRVVIPDTDAGLNVHKPAQGEVMVRVPRGIFNTFNSPQEVADYCGLAS